MRDPLQSRVGREEKRKVRMLSRPPKAPLLASKLKTAMWGSDSSGGVGKGLPASPPLSAPSFPSLSGQGHSPSTAQQKKEFRKGIGLFLPGTTPGPTTTHLLVLLL